jgi:lysyl endopeptidase
VKAWLSKAALAAVVAFTLAACGGGDTAGAAGSATAPVAVAALVPQVESFQPAQSGPLVLRGRAPLTRGSRPEPARIRLPRLDAPDPSLAAAVPGRPLQIGHARVVSATADAQRTHGLLQFQPGDAGDGPTAAVSFSSPGAAGIRLGLRVEALPPDARVRGYSGNGDTLFELSGRDILDAIARNRDSGDLGSHGGTFWTPAVESEEVTLQIALPPGAVADAIKVSVPLLSHLTVKAQALDTVLVSRSASCEIDVSCAPEVDYQSRATARMIFVSAGVSYACTGTLMNDTSSSGTPYFLSADHCISTQTAASSLTTYWFFRSPSCNAQTLSPEVQQLNGGATLLYASTDTDTSFMQLNAQPPAAATFAGWSAVPPAAGQELVGIHHPRADLQKISRGSLASFIDCDVPSPDTFSCGLATQATGHYLNARWSLGTVESGSSGSGLFTSIGASRYLVGQLKGGSASCLQPSGLNAYGRFDLAYNVALNRWLSPGPGGATVSSATAPLPRVPVYRFYNIATAAHFYTQVAAERDAVSALPTYVFEGIAFYAYDRQVAGASPVYRLYNRANLRHFYTMAKNERDWVLATYPEFVDEAISWYAQSAPGGAALPIYRFYSATIGSHFYTVSEGEKASVLQNFPTFALEGVAYYAWTTQ